MDRFRKTFGEASHIHMDCGIKVVHLLELYTDINNQVILHQYIVFQIM